MKNLFINVFKNIILININYNIIENGGEFKIKFHKTIRQTNNINTVVPYNENEMCCGNLGFSYI